MLEFLGEVLYYGFLPFVLLVLSLSVIRVVSQWNKAVILRFGKVRGIVGPGLVLKLPFVETIHSYVDMRTRTTMLKAEKTLTTDMVAVTVETVVFWHVVDVSKAVFAVNDYENAVEQVALTCMREMIGSTTLASLLSDRETADKKLRETIDRRVTDWGLNVISVDIKDVGIPNELLEVMSRQAQAERERDARVTLASAEVEIANKTAEAAKVYQDNPIALQLRQMGLTYDMAKNGTTIVIPSDMASSLTGGYVGSLLNKGK
jgi:regulator of protease activity HflC (stomatin/prohibitin superfamily)